MLITKNLETSIDLINPSDIYTNDLPALLMKMLIHRYVGRCHHSVMITKILQIYKHSDVMMVDNKLDGSARVDVMFEIEGHVYVKGEILNGCEIMEIHANGITAKHAHANIKLNKDLNSRLTGVLMKGMIIPVIVEQVMYSVNNTAISINGFPYAPSITAQKYYVCKSNTIHNIYTSIDTNEKILTKIKELYTRVESEQALHATYVKKPAYAFFQNMLYGYKTTQKYAYTPVCQKLKLEPKPLTLDTISAIVNGANGANGSVVVYPQEEFNKSVFYHSTMPMSSLVSVINEMPNELLFVEIEPWAMFSQILTEYLIYLTAVRSFIDVYEPKSTGPDAKLDDKLMKSMVAYWGVCNTMKK